MVGAVVTVAPDAPAGSVALNADHAASCPPHAIATIRSSICVVVRPVPVTAVWAVAVVKLGLRVLRRGRVDIAIGDDPPLAPDLAQPDG